MGEEGDDESPAATDGAGAAPAGRSTAARPRQAPPADGFGWRGWVLVGMVILSLIAIPAAMLVLPAARNVVASLGLTLRDAYLVLPLPAALLLGAVAVWSALASRRR